MAKSLDSKEIPIPCSRIKILVLPRMVTVAILR